MQGNKKKSDSVSLRLKDGSADRLKKILNLS